MKTKIAALLLVFLLLFAMAPIALGAPAETDPEKTELSLPVPGLIGIDTAKAGAAPAGERNKTMGISLPLISKSSAALHDVTITPMVSTNVESFPFKVDKLDYTKKYEGAMAAGAAWDVFYAFTVNNYATKGIKQVDFEISYREGTDPEIKTMILPVFVNITKGYSASTGSGTVSVKPTPKLIVESFTFSEDKLYAGEKFALSIVLRNTSATEGIRNLRVSIADPSGIVLPVGTGSGTLYIDEIEKDESVTRRIELQSAPDADAKAYTLALTFDYDGAASRQPFTGEASITMPITQRIRIKCDAPYTYEEMWAGTPFYMYMNIYNMGKSTVYNCSIDVEGEGLKMAETFFGGNIGSGSSLNAEFSLLAEMGGDLSGTVVVKYEDVYGEVLEQRMPLSDLWVSEMGGGEGADEWIVDENGNVIMPGGMEGAVEIDNGSSGGGGSKGWLYGGIGTVGLGGIATAIVLIMKKRRAHRLLGE